MDSVRRKLILDLEYLDTAGVSLDLRILLCTLERVLGLRGGRAVSLLGLQRKVTLPTTATRFDQAESGPKALTAVLFSKVCARDLSPDKPCNPVTVCVLGVLAAIFTSHLARFDLERPHGSV